MLANNYMTAEALGLTEVERQALVKVLGMLDRLELVPAKDRYRPTVPNGFHMGSVEHRSDCGTAACICGWAQIVAGQNIFDVYEGMNRMPSVKFHALFIGLFMWGDQRRFNINDPSQAAMALRSYLTTGDARWDLALAA